VNPVGAGAQPDGFVDLSQDRDALQRMLRELGLAGADEKPPVEMLTGGVSSSILRVDLARGPVCVKQALPKLKVAKDWFAPTGRVLAEIDWLSEAQRIVPGHVPGILGADRRRDAFVMEFLSGLRNWKSELLQGRIDIEVGAQLATVLGRIHAATALRPDMQDRFRNDANFYMLRLESYLVETARVHPDLARELIALVHVTQTTPRALVHGDVSPKNILLGAQGPVLLDAECAWYGDPAFDLAFLLNHMLLKSAFLPQHAPAFLALYECMVAQYLPLVAWEDVAPFEERCARLLPGLLLARVDGKSPVEYLTGPQRERVRAAARGMLGRPVASLADLLGQWRSALLAG
jgi:aminoglycoside phosphotransferase (APT) family kinase protein